MIVDPSGKQATEGPTGRSIIISEHIVKGTPSWGVECDETVDTLEALQVLSEVLRAIVVTQRQKQAQHKINNQVKNHLDALGKEK
ncbi:hypothetical protein [Caudoviricetes sp.]|nr:hypothetical protein [Caudoviricetes sp.]UOF79131.1 hypothetical protein [Caudoviricetes sp.]